MPIQPKPEPAATRIRYYIYGIIRKNSNSSVQVPSSYELAKMFNTTRRIAQYELERLVEEGVLIGKKRIGTFTNPLSNYSRHVTVDAMPLIGVTFGSGDHFTYAHEGAFALAATYQTLGQLDCFIHDLRLSAKSAAAMYLDIVSLKLDGLLWISPSPIYIDELFKRLAPTGIKIVSCGFGAPSSIVHVDYTFTAAAQELRNRLRTEKRCQIALWNTEDDPFTAAFRAIAEPDDFTFTVLNRKPDDEDLEPLEHLFSTGNLPDAILINPLATPAVYRLAVRHNIDFRSHCRLVALRDFTHQATFTGLYVAYDYAATARIAAQTLVGLVSGTAVPTAPLSTECALIAQNL